MDALAGAIPLRINFDLQLTLLASTLNRILAGRPGTGFRKAESRGLFRRFVRAAAMVDINLDEIVVKLGRRVRNPYLIRAGYVGEAMRIPWLDDRPLRLKCL